VRNNEANIQITLKAARVNAGLTILEVCKLLGFGKDTLIKYEKRKIMKEY